MQLESDKGETNSQQDLKVRSSNNSGDMSRYVTLVNANGKPINGKPSVRISKKRAERLLNEGWAVRKDGSTLLLLPKSTRKKRDRKLQTEFDPKAWLTFAEKKLESATAEYDKGNFGFALSALQGTEERSAKSILLQIGFLANNDSDLHQFLRIFVNEKYYQTPKALSHDWHRKVLEDFDDWLRLLHAIWYSQGKTIPGWRAKTGLSHFVSTLRKPIEKALKLESKYSPDLKELDETISGSNTILDMAKDTFKKKDESWRKNFPIRKEVHPPLGRFLKLFGLYTFKRDLDISYLEKSKIREMKLRWSQSARSKIYESTLVMVYVLITLAILNVFLADYHILGEYPNSKVKLDESFPMVAKFSDIQSLLLRALQMTKPYVDIVPPADNQTGEK